MFQPVGLVKETSFTFWANKFDIIVLIHVTFEIKFSLKTFTTQRASKFPLSIMQWYVGLQSGDSKKTFSTVFTLELVSVMCLYHVSLQFTPVRKQNVAVCTQQFVSIRYFFTFFVRNKIVR